MPRHTGSCECDAAAFANLRRHWHIDGLPSDFIPGTTDHYGTIHNFDMLCGVLLSDVHERMSGELCVYPVSHFCASIGSPCLRRCVHGASITLQCGRRWCSRARW
eukprot:COSAG01_NODE_16655_length_1217_cov_1.389982_1_plen_105_part_00